MSTKLSWTRAGTINKNTSPMQRYRQAARTRPAVLAVSCLAFMLAALSAPAKAEDRAKVYFDKLCSACHGLGGEGIKDVAAPAIAGLPEWYIDGQVQKFQAGLRGLHPADLPGMRMRPMALSIKSDDDRKAIAKYVAALPQPKLENTVKGSLVRGEQLYQTCVACHGADGKGNQQVQAPRIAGASDWYLLTQLKNFKAGVRGADPAKDPMGASMRGMAMALDDQAMLDVVAYITRL